MISDKASLLYRLILGIAALFPAVCLMYYIYRQDKIEKEPKLLLLKLMMGGIAAAGLSLVLENISTAAIQDLNTIVKDETIYAIALAVSVGVIEEGTKYFFLKLISWKDKAFDFRFDGVVYAVFVSLGFAAVENILYVLKSGALSVVFSRAFLAVPAHMAFGILMGVGYGRAKIYDSWGEQQRADACKKRAFISAAALHTFYDGTLLISTVESLLLFVGIVILLYILIFRKVKTEAKRDMGI